MEEDTETPKRYRKLDLLSKQAHPMYAKCASKNKIRDPNIYNNNNIGNRINPRGEWRNGKEESKS